MPSDSAKNAPFRFYQLPTLPNFGKAFFRSKSNLHAVLADNVNYIINLSAGVLID